MSKRIIAAIIGLLAIAAGLVACGFTLEVAHDFRSPETPFWENVFGSVFMGAVALCGLTFGIRFLQFAWFGTSQPISWPSVVCSLGPRLLLPWIRLFASVYDSALGHS